MLPKELTVEEASGGEFNHTVLDEVDCLSSTDVDGFGYNESVARTLLTRARDALWVIGGTLPASKCKTDDCALPGSEEKTDDCAFPCSEGETDDSESEGAVEVDKPANEIEAEKRSTSKGAFLFFNRDAAEKSNAIRKNDGVEVDELGWPNDLEGVGDLQWG